MTTTQIVQYLTDGDTIPDIAKKENISQRTLEKRVATLRKELNCKTIAQLVAAYLTKGLTSYSFK